MPAYRPGCSRRVSANLELARKQMLHSAVALDDHYEIDAFHADLKSPAASGNRKERRSAPSVRGAASRYASAAFRAKHERTFNHVRYNRDAFCVVEYLLRDALVRGSHDLVQYGAGMLEPVGCCIDWSVCPAQSSQTK